MYQPFKILKILMTFISIHPPQFCTVTGWRLKIYNGLTGLAVTIELTSYLFYIPSTFFMYKAGSELTPFQTFITLYGVSMMTQIFMMITTRAELIDIIKSINEKYKADGSHAEVENEQSRRRSLWLISTITILQVPTFVGGIINSEYIGNNEDSIKANIYFGRENPERLIAYLPWVPYDYTISPYFEVTKTLMYIALTMGCISMMVRYSLLPMLTFYINGQFDMIAKRFEHLKPDDEKRESQDHRTNEETILNDIIRSHQQALSLSKRVIVYFRPIIVIKTIFYFGILADLLYAVTEKTAGTSQQINCCFCLISCGYELLLDCWCGEYIARKSQLVGLAAYNSQWHSMSLNDQKSLAIVMARSQKPEQLNGRAGFIPMSLETYIQIFKASYSYYTVLQNLNKTD